MDILNWIYLKTSNLIRTKANNADILKGCVFVQDMVPSTKTIDTTDRIFAVDYFEEDS